jgi:hypothetical protein
MSLTGVGENSIGITGGFGYNVNFRGVPSSTGNDGSAKQVDAAKEKEAEKKASNPKDSKASKPLSPEQEKQVSELKLRDQQVRSHEQAHVSAGGQYVRGGASYEYQTGPDGKRYAVGGEVSIDTSSEKSLEATIAKMEVVKRAALAPADPSAQDRSVAAAASQKQLEAQMEMAAQSTTGAPSSRDGEAQGKQKEETSGNEAAQRKSPSPYAENGSPKTAVSGLFLDSYA